MTFRIVAWLEALFFNITRPFWFRGKGRLFRAISADIGLRQIRLYGLPVTLDLSDRIQRDIYLGIFEPYECRQVFRYLKPGMTFVDIGANVGYYTALASQAVGPAGRVLSVEPSPSVFGKLEPMIKGCSNVQVLACAVSSSPGKSSLYLPPAQSHNHSPSMNASDDAKVIQVEVRTLDEIFDSLKIDHVDLLKMDIEGYETHAFRGAQNALSSAKISAILCEFNDFWLRKAGSSAEELYSLITGAGFVPDGGKPNLTSGILMNVFFRKLPKKRDF